MLYLFMQALETGALDQHIVLLHMSEHKLLNKLVKAY